MKINISKETIKLALCFEDDKDRLDNIEKKIQELDRLMRSSISKMKEKFEYMQKEISVLNAKALIEELSEEKKDIESELDCNAYATAITLIKDIDRDCKQDYSPWN